MNKRGSNGATVMKDAEVVPVAKEWPGVRNRFIKGPPSSGVWKDNVLAEWELECEGWTDTHPHDEYAFVIEGTLHVQCEGVEHVLNQGDCIMVPAGSTGRYWAPQYARMFGIWGPNPEGEDTEHGECFAL